MAINDNILLKLREIRSSLTPIEKVIADYILENTFDIPHMSVKELSRITKTSDASVMRFCKTLGYSGYRDFIVSISSALGSRDDDRQNQYTDIRPGDDLHTIIQNISLNNCKSIEDTLKMLNEKDVEKTIKLLRSANRILFMGVGASGVVSVDAEQKFSRINKICHAYTEGHGMLTACTLLNAGDVALFISNSGDTRDILDSAEIAKKSGASIVAITKFSKNELAEMADIVLYISTPEITMRSGAMGSRIAMLNIIDILYAGVASAEYENVKKYIIKTHNVLTSKHKN